MGNQGNGVMISGANSEFIGGPLASQGSVIAGNTLNGVYIHGSSSALVVGNYIGTDGNSTPELGNKQNGILLDGGASSNKIGINGTSPLAAQENVISGNLGDGVCIVGDGTTQNCVSGNYIGTDEMASTEVPNGADGVCITGGASTNTIGGISQMAGNVIANNEGNGVSIDGSNSNYVQDNWIGTDASASMSIGNGRNGVLITDGRSPASSGVT